MNILRALAASLALSSILPAPASAQPAYPAAQRARDSAEALAAFRGNIGAIHARDRATYLTFYLQSERLARTGPGGVSWGYQGMAGGDPNAWPDTLIATHAEVVPLAPGVVYGAYRYRVVQGGSQRGVSERVLVKQPDGSWKVAVSTAFGSPGDAPVPAFALTGATVIDGTGGAPLRDATVVMRNGRIACVGRCEVGADVHTIDARGKWIIPGLIDAHMHYSQTGWADGRPDAEDVRARFPYDSTVAHLEAHPELFQRSYLCSGVTGTFDVGGYPWTWALRDRAERNNAAPRVAAAGPLLSTIDHWVNTPAQRQFVYASNDSSTRAAARMVAQYESDAVKVWYLADAPGADTAHLKTVLRAAADEARRAGIPLIVHATGLWEAKDALRAGARLLVHSVQDQPVDDEFIQLARQAGAIYTPTLTVAQGYLQLYGRDFDETGLPMECVDPATRAKAARTDSLPANNYPMARIRQSLERERLIMVDNLRRVHAAGIPVAMGTDAGNPLTLHGASVFREMEAMAAAGMSPMEVLVASTRTAAMAMGRDSIGTLRPGMAADLVVLDADPLENVRNLRAIRLVARGGEVWTRRELEYR
ncbi:MAG TPA: amidohydrolase family protein [Longimicrobium sp.]|jgi:imidazolonepropionase-like amidohydrolase|uniref:amidohydrolase family protein n=1 Tax=Longimicrobium sp. TaxID=2029185 RepID=UPI002EDA78FB